MPDDLQPTRYFRLPWSLNDNILGWLEPTKACNLVCEGCYSDNEPQSHKSIDQLRQELQIFASQRNVDSISIAGGDPLVHPRILDIVRMVRHEFGKKPVVNTNGLALTRELLQDLKAAGVFGFTFHVDSTQRRPHWKDKTEVELNALRLELARMVADAGGMSVAFNATVLPRTLDQLPQLVRWAAEHADIVHSMVFILFRTTRTREYDFFAMGKPVDPRERAYLDQEFNPEPLVAGQAVERIREGDPLYEPSAYLGGTRDPNSVKWLIAGRLVRPAADGREPEVMGYVGPRTMELFQNGHHLLTGTYLGYARPELTTHGRSVMATFSAIDPGTRQALGRWGRGLLSRPQDLARRVHFQTILVIQPIDFMADGEMNMCDGCPDITVHNGELVWSCRLDERINHGVFYTAVPKERPAAAPGD